MVQTEEQEQLGSLLRNSILLLSRSILGYRTQFTLDGLIGITIDQKEVLLFSLKETVFEDMAPSPQIPDNVVTETGSCQCMKDKDQDTSKNHKEDSRMKQRMDTLSSGASKEIRKSRGERMSDEPTCKRICREDKDKPPEVNNNRVDVKEELSHKCDESNADDITTESQESLPFQKEKGGSKIPTNPGQSQPPSRPACHTPLTTERHANLATRILTFPGPHAPIRSVQRRNGSYSSVNIADVMNAMTLPRNDPFYVGELHELLHESRPIRVFYKCPPDRISLQALKDFGVSIEEYKEAYESKPKSYLRDHCKDILYRDMLDVNSPFFVL